MKDRDYMILDIKPGNILYKYVDGIIYCMFSDYGMHIYPTGPYISHIYLLRAKINHGYL